MSDLVERLRSEATNLASNGWQTNCCSPGCGIASNLATEAADRIEQLEAQLKTAKAEGMEEAARIAYDQKPSSFSDDVGECAHNTAVQCANAIRAAKEKLQAKEQL